MTLLPRDLRYGLRRLNNNAGFTAVAVLCLALGICASITVFSVVDTLLLRPLPGVADQDRVVSLGIKPELLDGMGEVGGSISYGTFRRYREACRSFAGLAAYRPVALSLVAGEEPVRVPGEVVTDDYFDTLGLRPAAGRLMVAGEARRGAMPAVISHRLWTRIFGGRREAVGRPVRLNTGAFVIVGVAPAGFRGTVHGAPADVWLPVEAAPGIVPRVTAEALDAPKPGWLNFFVGRLAQGADAGRAQAELDLLERRFGAGVSPAEGVPGLQVYPGLGVLPGTRELVEDPLLLASAVVALLMLVVCANLGGLLLVKATARQEEIGVRLALGVTRLRLVRQLMAESLALALLGGAVGFALALFAFDALQGVSIGIYLPRIDELAVDGRVVAFTLVLTLGSCLLFGLVPALWSTRRQVVPLLRPGSGGGVLDRGRTSRLQEIFVVAQITISLILLISAGLFVRTLWNLRSIDPGFDSRRIVNLRVDLALQGYSEGHGAPLYDQLLAQARRLPGVRSAAFTLTVPLSQQNGEGRFAGLVRADRAADKPVSAPYDVVSPDHFRTLGIPLLRGRDFSAEDRAGSQGVLIVDELLAERLWPGRDPLGQRVTLSGPDRRVLQVVGVARSIRVLDLQSPQPYFYVPLSQHYAGGLVLQAQVASGDPMRVAGPLKALLRKLDSHLAVQVSRYEEEVQETLAQPRLFSWLLGSFSAVALLITALGLYGALSYLVSRRTRELGIRMALGARASEIVALVLRRGMALTLTGLVLGLVAASWTTAVFTKLLVGVTPTDPAVFVAVTVILTLVGLAASSLPAYSATRVDPMAVIRHE